MILTGRFPDSERAMIAFVKEVLGWRVFSEVPATWNTDPSKQLADLPCAVVERPPGGVSPSDYETAPRIDVSLFVHRDEGRTAVWDAVRDLESAIPSIQYGIGDVAIDEVSVPSGFGIVPYDNPKVRRAIGTIELVVRPW